MDVVDWLDAEGTPEAHAARDEIERLRAYVDAVHGKGSVRHVYAGLCPDTTQPDSRDPECPACLLLMSLNDLNSAGAEGAPLE